MKKKLLAMLLGLVISSISVTAAFAEFVYATKNGKKYHHVDSRFSKVKSAEKITIEEAEERGLEPSKDYLRRKAQEKEASK